ncbi:MAG: hypothetical protein VX397_01480 [Pseudomonadota bacterium]|nr:hypothetical protein [Pseudomonadota bacterium]
MDKIENHVQLLLEDYIQFWSSAKPTKLIDIWDKSEKEPFYIAEEKIEPIYRWDLLINYWKDAERILDKFSLRVWDVKNKQLSDKIVAINFMMHWNAIINTKERNRFGLDLRVSAVTRVTNAGLKFCQYTESPLGALPYIKRIYESNVDEKFPN